ncbi:MAG: two-component sensor histidine kinase, partial [Bacteroidales bacterium]|nr:two-component sensor histidine kinase [Bacteroidales bacterium]
MINIVLHIFDRLKGFSSPERFIVSVALLLTLSLSPFNSITLSAQEDNGIVLVISSYMSDYKQINDFVAELSNEAVKNNFPYTLMMDAMSTKGIEDIKNWKSEMQEILDQHKNLNLRGVFLLGQEAWASFLSLDSIPNVPFFVYNVTKYGVLLPDDTVKLSTWTPKLIDTEEYAREKGDMMGVFTTYGIEENIRTALSLFPYTGQIALLTDNTYAGVAMQTSFVNTVKESFSEMNLILLDGREDNVSGISEKVASLPPNTVLFIGTWSVDNSGLFFLQNSIESIVKGNPNLPVFSLTGLGMDSVAIGGYVPNNITDANLILHIFEDYLSSYYYDEGEDNHRVPAQGFYLDNSYIFNRNQLEKYVIEENQLPDDNKVVDDIMTTLNLYKNVLGKVMAISIISVLIILVLAGSYYKIRKLNIKLKQNEKNLIRAKEQAEESEMLKSAFLANMSHEIRTPLNAIVGFSSVICDEEDLSPEEKKKYSDLVSTNSNLLLGLIEDILDLSSLESKRADFTFTDESVREICENAILSIGRDKKDGIEYSVSYGKNDFILRTDKYRLMQVLDNFLSNANKFTESGSIVLSYEVNEEKNRVYFAVTDTGCGISKEQRKTVFDRFAKFDD